MKYQTTAIVTSENYELLEGNIGWSRKYDDDKVIENKPIL